MPSPFPDVRAVVFDYGNTVVPFGPPEVGRLDAALAGALRSLFGSVDEKRLREIRDLNRRAPYAGDPPEYVENDPEEIVVDMVRELYGRVPRPDELATLLRIRQEAFLEVIAVPEGVRDLLAALKRGRRLGMLSNYPDGEVIRQSLERVELARLFDAVVVSADLGRVKPHPVVFRAILKELGTAPEQTLFVGDNWLADVQGAKRAGMRVVQMTRWDPPEKLPTRPDDVPPDAVIRDLRELVALIP